MKHLILTRMKFEDVELMGKYVAICKEILIPQLHAQTCNAFDWFLMCNEQHREYLAAQLDYPFIAISNNREFVAKAHSQGYNYQTRHDCDDWMHRDYVKEIQKLGDALLRFSKPLNYFLIQSQPRKWDLRTGEIVDIPPYHSVRTSMHITLVQRMMRTNIHARNHGQMYAEVQAVADLPRNMTRWVIHGDNVTLIGKGKKVHPFEK